MVQVGGVAGDQLKNLIDRIERLEEEKQGIAADIREIYAEARGNGFDVKAIREIIKQRKLDVAERHEREMVLDTYMRALGMLPELDESEPADEPDLPVDDGTLPDPDADLGDDGTTPEDDDI